MKSETKEKQRREDDETSTGSSGKATLDGTTTAPTKFNSKENGSPTNGGKNGSGAACNDYRSHVLHRKVTAFADS